LLGTRTSLPVDTVAPKIRGVESIATPTPDDAPVVRFAVSDNTTTDGYRASPAEGLHQDLGPVGVRGDGGLHGR
jgi:hypothetical protein